MRRPTFTGNKVSNIAKHFERINKDTDKANRRYAVIRGRKARPVTTARAKAEILDSIKDAIKDESESSDSSEADDEGDDEDEAHEAPGDAEKKLMPSADEAQWSCSPTHEPAPPDLSGMCQPSAASLE